MGENTGWIPLYVTAWEKEKPVGGLAIYQKNQSYGEYIFDWEWARAFQANGVPYYPKLTAAIPFTPATGPKLLLHPECDQEAIAALLIQSALALLGETQSHSLHFLFISDCEIPFYLKQGFLVRHSFQYHWKNHGYRSFSDFLEQFKSKKAKQVLREREQLREQNISIELLSGDRLTEEHADLMYQFYLATTEKMGAIPYLTREFFRIIFKEFSENVIFLLARKEGRPIAGTLSYFRGKNLYGRYWGAFEEVRNLHFELCYYRLIEFAIEHQLERFEAGAQGEHKIQRGFLPELTYSAHHITHPGFRHSIADFLTREKEAIEEHFRELGSHSPFANQVAL